jgi:hypothetical protein
MFHRRGEKVVHTIRIVLKIGQLVTTVDLGTRGVNTHDSNGYGIELEQRGHTKVFVDVRDNQKRS